MVLSLEDWLFKSLVGSEKILSTQLSYNRPLALSLLLCLILLSSSQVVFMLHFPCLTQLSRSRISQERNNQLPRKAIPHYLPSHVPSPHHGLSPQPLCYDTAHHRRYDDDTQWPRGQGGGRSREHYSYVLVPAGVRERHDGRDH